MKDSESKALNWSGIIPDVNDINIQGTFRYVENQVNTVGGNFKKFCSVVVQDLFPLSPKSVESKARSSIPEESSVISADLVKPEDKEVVKEENSECSVAETCSSEKSSLVAIDDAETNVSKESGEVIPDDVFREPTNGNPETTDKESGEDATEPVEELVDATHKTECVVSIVSGSETLPSSEGGDLYDFLPHDTTKSDASPKSKMLPLTPSPVEPAPHVYDSPSELPSPTLAEAMPLMKDIAVEKQFDLSSSKLSMRSKDDSIVEIPVVDLGMETINLHDDEVKLKDSCAFIDDTVLHAVARRARKLGSYRKKIQDIFTSKRRLAKEYEQLAIWYGDSDTSSKPNPSVSQTQTRHGCDFDWELL